LQSQGSIREIIEDKLKLALRKKQHSRSSSSDDAIQVVSILSIKQDGDRCSNLFSIANHSDSASHKSQKEPKSADSLKKSGKISSSQQSRDSLSNEGFSK